MVNIRRFVLVLAVFCAFAIEAKNFRKNLKKNRNRKVETEAINSGHGSLWWRLAYLNGPESNEIDDMVINQNKIVKSLHFRKALTRQQQRLVRKHPGLLEAVTRGLRMAISECKYQFRDRRWNCPTSDFLASKSTFGPIVQKGILNSMIYLRCGVNELCECDLVDNGSEKKDEYEIIVCGLKKELTDSGKQGGNQVGLFALGCRETSFVYAITSAGVAHAVARGCSEGEILTCPCVYRRGYGGPDRSWEWGGCGDNVDEGNKLARKFIDVTEQGSGERFLMNLHNNEVGRTLMVELFSQHVRELLTQECKCHGMSGSCSIKTCWARLRNFRDIGNNLKDRFDGASKVTLSNKGNFRKISSKGRLEMLVPKNPGLKYPSKVDLVYYEQSPDFCVPNASLGLEGTRGRRCNETSQGLDGCELLCCGRGHRSIVRLEEETCNCRFNWCCNVTCESCTHKKVISTCL
ncbi:WNT1 [Cordylochernes scorpioides]|uniref:Protein Wnt n=1 Tax=Cordylochernes scorpioides TaxID=51811 RepID=A0ABY6KFM1_9ARAC|nr:WNT1 [Cordylochernes scorpioides]